MVQGIDNLTSIVGRLRSRARHPIQFFPADATGS